MSILVAGTVAIDNIKTPTASHENLLGGSASFAAIAANFFADTNLVGVVGDDFPVEHLDLFRGLDINLDGLQIVEGGTSFRWTGEYFDNMNRRETLDTHLGVIETFQPSLTPNIASCRVVLLANMSPRNQLDTLALCKNPAFVIADTMDLWINIARHDLMELLGKLDLLVINDSEAEQLAETHNLIVAGDILRSMGPANVIIKKGEHGALLFGPGNQFFSGAAYPLRDLHDPTGAGDTFAGGLAGHLAAGDNSDPITFDDLCHALVYGSALASFSCETFSTLRLHSLSREELDARIEELKRFSHLP